MNQSEDFPILSGYLLIKAQNGFNIKQNIKKVSRIEYCPHSEVILRNFIHNFSPFEIFVRKIW